MAVHDVGVGFAITGQGPCSGDAPPNKNLAQALANFCAADAIRVIKGMVPDQWIVAWATKGSPINFAKLTASIVLVACVTER